MIELAPTTLEALGLTPATGAAFHLTSSNEDLAGRIRGRVDTENLGIYTVNVPVGGAPKTETSGAFFAQARNGLKIFFESNSSSPNQSFLENLISKQDPKDIQSAIKTQLARLDRRTQPDAYIFGHCLTVLGLLGQKGCVSYNDFDLLSPKGLGKTANCPTFWNRELTPDVLFNMLNDLSKITTNAIYSTGIIGISNDLLRAGHFFALGQELTDQTFKI